MATELKAVTLATPAETTTVTPVIRRPIWGRLYDAVLIACALAGALLMSLGDFDYTSLGFTKERAAWISLAVFCVRFVLAWQPPKLLTVKTEPGNGGQG